MGDAWATITGGENLLVLAANPGDESRYCGGLIAQSCGRGRPPYLMVLTDGSGGPGPDGAALAARRERETRAAAAALGLERDRVLMAGLFDGTVPEAGPVFEAVVRAVTLVMWARDCNLLCAPAGGEAHHAAAARVAAAVAAGSGVGLVGYGVAEGRPLPLGAAAAAKAAAWAAHGWTGPVGDEAFRTG